MPSLPRTAVGDLAVYRERYKHQADHLLWKVRQHYIYPPGDNRASSYLSPDLAWLTPILADLATLLGVHFTIVALQGYKDGTAGTAWHADDNFGDQAIVSLGATRALGVRHGGEEYAYPLETGDLIYMPTGLEHRIIPQPDVTDERVALVFRVPQ